MNRLDVRALGWVVTRDACSELLRVALGKGRHMPVATLRELGDRWGAVSASPAGDQRRLHGLFLATALSGQHEKAVLEFIEMLQNTCPGLYGEHVLRQRYLNAICQAIASFTLGALLACWASSELPIIGESALVLFAIACWSLATAVQLRRTHCLVRQLRQYRSLRGPVTRQTLAGHHDRS